MRWLTVAGIIVAVVIAATAFWVRTVVVMPGASWHDPLPFLTDDERKIAECLRRDVALLASGIGERNVDRYDSLATAANAIDTTLTGIGYHVTRQSYSVDGRVCQNLIAEIPGRNGSDEIIIIGAHYDSAPGTAGANDNASGVAALLALARMMQGERFDRTIRLVAFVNEEPPYFQTELMGSLVYARACRKRNENIVAMLSLETMGYYSDVPGSQHYPAPLGMFYPSVGNFIAFVSNRASIDLLHHVIGTFRDSCRFPSEGAAAPEFMQGIGWSDQWSFWQVGYPALMITDTAPFRYPFYHTPDDTAGTIDYERFARVTLGIHRVVVELAGGS
jgi:Zn-dependent M28 family amino/carboxypeptidase